MASGHLSCLACHIRVRANAPEVTLLEGRCPLCGVTLRPASSASDVVGFRSFGLDALSQQEPGDQPTAPPGIPVDLVARREAGSAREDLDADRWSDNGGSVKNEAVTKRLAAD
jgi:hypothetical protein